MVCGQKYYYCTNFKFLFTVSSKFDEKLSFF